MSSSHVFPGIEDIPATTPPEGVTPNFINPPSIGKTLTILNGVWVSLAMVFVVIRLGTRSVSKQLGWDDYTCVAASIVSIAHAVVMAYQIKIGYGRHLWDFRAIIFLDKSNIQLLATTAWVYLLAIYLAKVSILLLYLRVFSIERTFKWTLWVILAFLSVYTLAMLSVSFATLSHCTIESADSSLCTALTRSVGVLIAVINVTTDFSILCLPLPLITKLQMTAKKKLAIGMVFLTGLIACVASLARTIFVCTTFNGSDTLFSAARVSLFTIVEMNAAIISGCLLTLPSFLHMTRGFGSRVYSSLNSWLDEKRSRSQLGDLAVAGVPVQGLDSTSILVTREAEAYSLTSMPSGGQDGHSKSLSPSANGLGACKSNNITSRKLH